MCSVAFQTKVIETVYPASDGVPGLTQALERVCQAVADAALQSCTLIVLSDRNAGKQLVPIRYWICFMHVLEI